jgi:hypothetical protein
MRDDTAATSLQLVHKPLSDSRPKHFGSPITRMCLYKGVSNRAGAPLIFMATSLCNNIVNPIRHVILITKSGKQTRVVPFWLCITIRLRFAFHPYLLI